MKILWISMCAPYVGVRHAGGNTVYHYINELSNREDIEITLLTFCREDEAEKIREGTEKYKKELIVGEETIKKYFYYLISLNSRYNPFYSHGEGLLKYLADKMFCFLWEQKNKGYYPDIVIMEWTVITSYINKFRRVFPKSKYVASEHDVTFQKYERQFINERNMLKKWNAYIRYGITKKNEIKALKACDLIVVHNKKDLALLFETGIKEDRLFDIVPYYHRSDMQYGRSNNNIIFFGNMSRNENIQAARWFATNVMPRVKDIDVKFIIIGAGGKENIGDLQSENIDVIGYVKDTDIWFSQAMCFVAPLKLGAGIKVKCIEALQSGIPVLTNHIGIEGIPAVDGKDYILCEKPEEYESSIRRLYAREINISGMRMIQENFNLESSVEAYVTMLRNISCNLL